MIRQVCQDLCHRNGLPEMVGERNGRKCRPLLFRNWVVHVEPNPDHEKVIAHRFDKDAAQLFTRQNKVVWPLDLNPGLGDPFDNFCGAHARLKGQKPMRKPDLGLAKDE